MREEACTNFTNALEDIQEWEDVRRNPSVPFVHKFETKDNKYIFDVNTKEILRVDDIVWDIVNDFGDLSKEQIIAKYNSKYEPGKIAAAFDNIEKAQQHEGLLLSHRPEVRLVLDESRIASELKKRMQLILNATEECNFRCSYCYFSTKNASWRRHSRRKMSWETAKASIDDFLEHTELWPLDSQEPGEICPTVSFYGGEPLLNFDLVRKCAKYIRKKTKGKAVLLGLTTNGYLLKGKVADFLASQRFTLTLSLDGPASLHDKCRRTPDGLPTWKVVTNNIRNFINKYPRYAYETPISMNAVVSRFSNMLEVQEFFANCDWLPKKASLRVDLENEPEEGYFDSIEPVKHLPDGLEVLYVKYLRNLASGRINADPEANEFKVQRSLFERLFQLLHKRSTASSKYPRLPDVMFPTTACVAGARRQYVSVEGGYYPCEKIPECEENRIGNVAQGIDEPKVYEMLKAFVESTREECKYCWCLSICSAGCYANVREGPRFSHKAKKKACARGRQTQHDKLVDYCTVLEKNRSALDFVKEITVT